MPEKKTPETNAPAGSPRIPAGAVSIVLTLLLLLAGGAFVLSGLRHKGPGSDSRASGSSAISRAQLEEASDWLGLDAIRQILDPDSENRDAGTGATGAEAFTADAGAFSEAASATSTSVSSAAASAANTGASSADTGASTPETSSAAAGATGEKASSGEGNTKEAKKTEEAAGQNDKEDAKDSKEQETAKDSSAQEASKDSKKQEAAKDSSAQEASKDSKKQEAAKDSSAQEASKDSKKQEAAKDSSAQEASKDSKESGESEEPGSGLTKLQKKYVKAWEDFHGRTFPLNAPLHNYNWKYLSFDENGILHYKGDEIYTIRRGIDVSEFQGKIDWEKVRKAGIEFVFVRAGHRTFHTGDLQKDSRAVKNLRRAKEAGLEVGVYVFSQAVTKKEAREEAQLCLDVIEESGVEITLPVAFDPEIQVDYYARLNDISGKQFTDNTVTFCETIRKAGYTPAVYANSSTETDILDMSRLEDTVIWYADYNSTPDSPYDFTFWQYTNLGWVDGIPETETDLNVWFVKKTKKPESE